MKQIVILYHADCPDGFSAAWAAWKKFGVKADYIGAYYDKSVPGGLKHKKIYMLDFVYPQDIMQKLIKDNEYITAIDHHVSMEKETRLTRDYLYDLNHSGAVLAWQYFHSGKPMPNLLKYVEDTDLWRFRMPDSRDVFAYFNLQNRDFKTWSKIASDLQDKKKIKEYVKNGKIINQYISRLVKEMVEEGKELVNFEGHNSYLINAPHFFSSLIGHELYKRKPPIGIIWNEVHGMINVSLRSDGTVDVSKIAAKYGGGGHKASAGFSLPSTKSFPWSEKKQN